MAQALPSVPPPLPHDVLFDVTPIPDPVPPCVHPVPRFAELARVNWSSQPRPLVNVSAPEPDGLVVVVCRGFDATLRAPAPLNGAAVCAADTTALDSAPAPANAAVTL